MSIIQVAKSWLGRGLVTSRLNRVVLGAGGIVVVFHRVNDLLPGDGLTRSSRDFERFCRFFRSYFDVISLGEHVSRLASERSLAGTLVITFDDGYLDNIEVAAPILRRFALPATFFVTTSFIESSIVPWWDAGLARHPGWMSWEQVRSLAAEGFDIGGHTRTHPDLGQIDGEQADLEIAGCRDDLRCELGAPPAHFAYPYGRVENMRESNRERVKRAGYHCCVSSFGGISRPPQDPFRLPRVSVDLWHRTPEQFAFEVLVR